LKLHQNIQFWLILIGPFAVVLLLVVMSHVAHNNSKRQAARAKAEQAARIKKIQTYNTGQWVHLRSWRTRSNVLTIRFAGWVVLNNYRPNSRPCIQWGNHTNKVSIVSPKTGTTLTYVMTPGLEKYFSRAHSVHFRGPSYRTVSAADQEMLKRTFQLKIWLISTYETCEWFKD
jgi:hypothetical protein